MGKISKQEILIKVNTLISKWKDKVPEKFSAEWWRYRADQIYFRSLSNELKKFGKK